MKRYHIIIIVYLLLTNNFIAAQNSQIHKNINEQLWFNFTKAFETLDHELFDKIHTSDLIRVGGDGKTILQRENYLNGYKERWDSATFTQTIAFRFTERICTEDIASERGIYKLTRYPNTDNEWSYYGKFHVILEKDDTWKIKLDYDSSEGKTINENSYRQAYAIDDFEKF